MTTPASGLMTAAAMAKELGVSDAKVKKAIADLALQPAAKKGSCCYYGADALKKVKSSIK
jgi:predicted ArsR family transcriptional regulator